MATEVGSNPPLRSASCEPTSPMAAAENQPARKRKIAPSKATQATAEPDTTGEPGSSLTPKTRLAAEKPVASWASRRSDLESASHATAAAVTSWTNTPKVGESTTRSRSSP